MKEQSYVDLIYFAYTPFFLKKFISIAIEATIDTTTTQDHRYLPHLKS